MSKTESKTETPPEVAESQPTSDWTPPAVKRHVVLPLIKPQIGRPVYIEVSGPMFDGKEIKDKKDPDTGEMVASMAKAKLVNCIALETGEVAQIIVPAVLLGIFEDEYPNDAYVGKRFMLTKQAKASGKRYHNFSVAELE